MLYLILAIISSACVTLFMRLGDRHVKNNMVMFTANYIVCALLSYLFIIPGGVNILPAGNGANRGMAFAVTLGLISGVLYLGSFMLLQFNIRKNGMVLAATFMKLGVLVPIVISVALRWDVPTLLQIVGCVLAVAAIIIINGEGGAEKGVVRAGMWLVVLLLVGGLTDSLSNIYDKLGAAALKDHYLLFTFIAAAVVSFVFIFVRGQHFTGADAFWGALIGIPNYFSSRFLLYALADVPAIVAYPVYNIAVILLISPVGFFAFREKLSKRKLVGMAVIIAAILALNL